MTMKKILKSTLLFLKDTLLFCYFILHEVRYYFRFGNKFPYRHRGGKVAVLANGPSLKEALAQREHDAAFHETDFIVLNFFAFDPIFQELKLQHYCLADPTYFEKNHRYDEVQRLFGIFQNEVTWDMYIYIPAECHKKFIAFSQLNNPRIHIVNSNTAQYFGYTAFRNWFYKKGLAMPRIQTVANLAIYIAINAGYDEINLFGVDHTFFDGIMVDENNRLCRKHGHFNEKGTYLKPVLDTDGSVIKISEELQRVSIAFKMHDILADYAEYIGCKIFNCTQCSLIDSYPRRK